MLTLFENIETDLSESLKEKVPTFINALKKYSIDNPVTSKKIESGMKIKGIEVRAIVRHCRREGYPVGSSARGYFWIHNADELEKTIAHLKERASSIEKTISEMNYLKKFIK